MKLASILGVLVLCIGLGATTARAQGCPYTVAITSYGSACSDLSTALPSLIGGFPAETGCQVGLLYDAPAICCNVLMSTRWMIAGLSPASVSLPGGGCPLLVTPDVIAALPALEGGMALKLLRPSNPALIGVSIYLQGIDRRFETIGGTIHLETSNGLRLDIL